MSRVIFVCGKMCRMFSAMSVFGGRPGASPKRKESGARVPAVATATATFACISLPASLISTLPA